MKKLLLSFLLALALSCTSCSLTRSVRDLYTETGPAVFLLELEEGWCSSFHIGNGLVLTAAHCIADQKSTTIHVNKDLLINNPLVLLDDDYLDVAILSAPELANEEFAVLGQVPKIGERLTTIGFPGYLGKKTVDVGYVIDLGPLDGVPVIFGSGNAFPGESGGPVLDERGFTVGLVSRISARGIMFSDGRHLHRDVSVFISTEVLQKALTSVLTIKQ